MPTYDHGVAGLTGTIGVTVYNADLTLHDARATAGITEPVAGSGIYHIAHPHPGTLLLFIFDGGVGTVGGSCFDDGLTPTTRDAATKAAMEAAGSLLHDAHEAVTVTIPATLTGIATNAASAAGADFGDDTCTLTIRTTDGATVITDAQVYIGDDATPTNRTRTKTTDSLGKVVFDLTDGTTYYLWVLSDAFDGTNPTSFVAAKDV